MNRSLAPARVCPGRACSPHRPPRHGRLWGPWRTGSPSQASCAPHPTQAPSEAGSHPVCSDRVSRLKTTMAAAPGLLPACSAVPTCQPQNHVNQFLKSISSPPSPTNAASKAGKLLFGWSLLHSKGTQQTRLAQHLEEGRVGGREFYSLPFKFPRFGLL